MPKYGLKWLGERAHMQKPRKWSAECAQGLLGQRAKNSPKSLLHTIPTYHCHRYHYQINKEPCPSFPCFFGIPCFFSLRGFPCSFDRFPFFSRDFRGSVGIKNPCFFGGFPCLFPKKNKERKDREVLPLERPTDLLMF